MDFLFTVYAWPLEKPISISKYSDFTFDNPRTKEEIKYVQEFIQKAYIDEYRLTSFTKSSPAFAQNEELMNLLNETPYGDLSDYIKSFASLNPQDEYARSFQQDSLSQDELVEHISKIWIIARYSSEEELHKNNEFGELLKASIEGLKDSSLNHLNLERIKLVNQSKPSQKLKAFSYLFSLLISDGEYTGKTFLVDGDGFSFSSDVGINKTNLSSDFCFFSVAPLRGLTKGERKEINWLCFPSAIERISSLASLLDNAFGRGDEEKLYYISNLLRTISYEVSDGKIKLLMLTGIIELLVTHNPDNNRYNVEDSITKQFKLKAGLLMYLTASDSGTDKSRKLQIIKDDLKTIYDLRSSIAHGSFQEIQKIISKRQKVSEKYDFEYYIRQSYKYVKVCIYHYLRDPEFVRFIKDG